MVEPTDLRAQSCLVAGQCFHERHRAGAVGMGGRATRVCVLSI